MPDDRLLALLFTRPRPKLFIEGVVVLYGLFLCGAIANIYALHGPAGAHRPSA
jgi:hypothetical protein